MAPTEKVAEDDVPEDTPMVKELKELDEKYMAVHREFEKERQALQRKYTALQKPLLEEREKELAAVPEDASEEDKKTGTPACKGFWLQALQNHPEAQEYIEDTDEPVLEYIKDIVAVDLDPEDMDKGFRLKFIFAENPYFTNAVLSKEVHTQPMNAYNGEVEVDEVIGCTIDWKAGKDVTVKKVAKKVKGGGAKKAKQAGKMKEEPCPSFFRSFFRSMKKGGRIPETELPETIEHASQFMGGDPEEEEVVEFLMEQDFEVAHAIKENVIPFAVRWYTGEACPEGMDDSDDDEDEESEDDDDDESSEEEAPPAKGKGNKAGGAKKKGVEDAKPKEECKQQ